MKRVAAALALLVSGCATAQVDRTDWLSDASSAPVRQWVAERNEEYAAQVASLESVGALAKRIEELAEESVSSEYYRLAAGSTAYSLSSGPQFEGTVILEQPSGRLIFDPKRIARAGRWTIDWFVPSPDGRKLAVSASPDGTERGTLFIVDTGSGTIADHTIFNVNNATAGGDVAWSPGGEGFYYTRYPQTQDEAEGASNQQVFYHALGTPARTDRPEFTPPSGKLAEIRLVSDARFDRFAAWVQDGDSGTFALYLRRGPGEWQQVAGFGDKLVQPFFGPEGELYLVSRARNDAGEIMKLDWSADTVKSAVSFAAVPVDAAYSASFYSHGVPAAAWLGDRLYVTYQAGGPMGLAAYDRRGELEAFQTFGVPSSVRSFYRDAAGVHARIEDYLSPARWVKLGDNLEYTASGRRASDTVTVVRDFAVSADGTRIPFTMLKDRALDLPVPALVYGYGGFGSSRTPAYDPELRALLERGVVFVDTNIRGGSEYGEAWRQAGMRRNRQRVYDDFQSILRHLHQKGVTKPEWTAIEGASNGGLLMGVTLTQAPQLARTVLAHVGLYDMMRYRAGVNGAFNVAEYGDLDDPEDRSALLAYSPLQNVRSGVDYPAVLMTVGANDPRVDPAHSRRMLEALRQSDPDTEPMLLRTDFGAGHYGGGRQENIRRRAEEFAFLLARFRAEGWQGGRR